ncbi:MAG: hypothetical protein M1820_001375 [Bogoriella megaspora]|nr:MAG: hypothetical protein M1820_001375 [Bogoriella megaspora]
MFVLPPPPRYPAAAIYSGTGGSIPLVETNNTLTRPTGAEHQLSVGEGTYVLRDDLHLATPPPHPSEAPVVSNNPLATVPQPPTVGTKLSPVILIPRLSPSYRFYSSTAATGSRSIPPSIQEEAHTPTSDGKLGSHLNDSGTPSVSHFGEGNPSLAAVNGKESKDTSKRRKPKSNIIKSNSSFVSRVITHEALQKRLQEHPADGLLVFANVNRAFQWLDFASDEKKSEPLTKILFTKAHALCHDVNPITKSAAHIDLVMGFNYADVIWYEPITQKYSRINKNGVINPHPVTHIAWLPGSEHLFLASHMDGTLIVYDREKEDAVFVAEDAASQNEVAEKQVNGSHGVDRSSALQVKKSVQSRNQKTNPVAVWKVSNQKINAFAISSDGAHLAVASEDGSLRIINYLQEQVLDLYTSYYGGFVCVCWSPDGRYVVTGGQDDLVCIWSLQDRMLVARCQGHNSWVTAVAFDPWRCDERNYRFGSVGEDCRLLLWDFSVGMLHRPKASSVRQRGSVSSHVPPSLQRKESNPLATTPTNTTSASRFMSNSSLGTETEEGATGDKDIVVHPVEPRGRIAVLPPVMAKKVDDHPLSWLGFEEDCILTSCQDGHIRTWNRPKEGTGPSDGSSDRPRSGT